MSTADTVDTADSIDTVDAAERIEQAPPLRKGLTVWFAVFGGIGAWTVHLLFVASFVQYSCNTGNTEWPMHLVTVVTAGATVVAIALAVRLVRAGQDRPEDEPTPGGRLHYLGIAGVLIGVVNLALILLEGSYVVALNSCVR
jgi:hypothetical protein